MRGLGRGSAAFVSVMLWIGGCGGEPAGEPAFDSRELDGLEGALHDAFDELEQRHGVEVDPARRERAVTTVRDRLEEARTKEPVAQTRRALEDEDVASDDLERAVGSNTASTNGTPGVSSGATAGQVGTTAAGTSGTPGTSNPTGGTFQGAQGATQSPIGHNAGQVSIGSLPCHDFNEVHALTEEDFTSGGFFPIACVSAGSRPILRWPELEGAAPFELLTIAVQLDTARRLASSASGEATVSLLRNFIWGPITVNGTSITYGGPPLAANGGIGILVGLVETSAGQTGLFIALVV